MAVRCFRPVQHSQLESPECASIMQPCRPTLPLSPHDPTSRSDIECGQATGFRLGGRPAFRASSAGTVAGPGRHPRTSRGGSHVRGQRTREGYVLFPTCPWSAGRRRRLGPRSVLPARPPRRAKREVCRGRALSSSSGIHGRRAEQRGSVACFGWASGDMPGCELPMCAGSGAQWGSSPDRGGQARRNDSVRASRKRWLRIRSTLPYSRAGLDDGRNRFDDPDTGEPPGASPALAAGTDRAKRLNPVHDKPEG